MIGKLKTVGTRAGLGALTVGVLIGSALAGEPAVQDELLRQAEEGDSTAQARLALHYEKGKGRPVDRKEALRWLRKAAEQGNALAQAKLGFCYETGNLVEKDDRKAFEWIRRSAENGYFGAQFDLANRYRKGDQVAKDKVRAFMWFEIAAAADLTPSSRKALEELAKELTKEEIAEARRLGVEQQRQIDKRTGGGDGAKSP